MVAYKIHAGVTYKFVLLVSFFLSTKRILVVINPTAKLHYNKLSLFDIAHYNLYKHINYL